MTPYSRNVHHRGSIRLPAYDYRSPGAYYVTICTFERQCLFDDPRLRRVAAQIWKHVTTRSRNRRGDAFVVMPNHIHGIIWITHANPVGAQHTASMASHQTSEDLREPRIALGSGRAAPLRLPRVESGSLGAIVHAFKSASSRRVNEIRGTPGSPVWQRNYYERVLRNEDELDAARRYIADNPRKWAEDPNHPSNLANNGIEP